MIRRYQDHDIEWIDLESPTLDEVTSIANEFDIAPELVQELVTPTDKPRVDLYPSQVYAVFHFPTTSRGPREEVAQEIDIVLGNGYLITARYRPIEAIDDFARAFEVTELLQRGASIESSGYLLLELAGRLYHASEGALDTLEEAIRSIEQHIFSGNEREMVTTISRVGRELVIHKRMLGNHSETLEALQAASTTLFGDTMKNYFRGVAALHYRAHARATSMAETVTELRETNLALLSTRQNEIMKNLTVITAVMLPLTLVANVFSMNTTTLPITGSAHDFWLIMGLMAIVAALFFAYFKIKRWF